MPKQNNNFDYLNSKAFLRDRVVDFKDANLSIASSPVLYGLSVYTVAGANFNTNTGELFIFRLKDHYQRLVDSASIMNFTAFHTDWSYSKFEKTVTNLLNVNKVSQDVLIRATVFVDELIAGTKARGLKNSLAIYVYPVGEILPRSGVSLGTSAWVRNADNAIPSRAKVNGSYANASLIKDDAISSGFDDALVLDQSGHIVESTVANIFITRGNQLITPDHSSDLLEGITRNTVTQIARQKGISIIERSVDRSEVYICDEAFLCGSSASITPVLSVDNRQIGGGKPGKVTSLLSKAYFEVQRGKLIINDDWLVKV